MYTSTCLQFAGDTTLYKRCKVILDCANIQNDVEHLKAWFDVNNLVFWFLTEWKLRPCLNKIDKSTPSSRQRRYLFICIKCK